MNIDIIKLIAEALCAIFAIAAAVLWYKSAKVELPDKPASHVVLPGVPVSIPNNTKLEEGLKRQSILSAQAAICAAIAALLQGVIAIIDVFFTQP